jgi:phage gp36-like protein
MLAPFATLADIQQRHPREIAVLAADETTRTVDPVRVERACEDASMEIRSILQQRYTAQDLAQLTAESLGLLKLYCIDIAMHRVALSFSRSTEQLKERADTAFKRLSLIATGKGALETTGSSGVAAGSNATLDGVGPIAPAEPVIVANERLFTRGRYAGGRS